MLVSDPGAVGRGTAGGGWHGELTVVWAHPGEAWNW